MSLHGVDRAVRRSCDSDRVRRARPIGPTGDLDEYLSAAQEYAANLDISLVWDTPVPYSQKNPFALEFKGRERPPGAGHAWLYVEPDGDVLPDQEINVVLGNLVRDSWEQVWQAALDRLD